MDASCKLSATVRKGKTRVGRRTRTLSKGKHRLRIKIVKKRRKSLRAGRKLTVTATCANAAGKSKAARRTVKLRR